uniref:EF-hand domain-containing protein n=1 Tax=Steinernema glaseri TaxID=37863 RepID=A0A1I7YCA3_9BILA
MVYGHPTGEGQELSAEYEKMVGRDERRWKVADYDSNEEHRDKNGDGKLDQNEMRDWIMPVGFDHADAEAKHLVHIADDDKDGKLSPEEIIAHYDTFVGSQ